MSATLVQELEDQSRKFWGPMVQPEIMETAILPSIITKPPERLASGTIKEGNTVYLSQIIRPEASRKVVGAGHEKFETSKLSTRRVPIEINQVFSVGYELDDLIDLQTQLGSPEGKQSIRRSLVEALQIKINKYAYSLVAPKAAHIITGVTDFNATQLSAMRKRAAKAKWAKDEAWWLLPDASYYTNLLDAQTLTAEDGTAAGDKPIVGGMFAKQRYNFNIVEDNTDGLLDLTSIADQAALAFHPDFAHLVLGEADFQISSGHSNKTFGYTITAKIVGGGGLGLQGEELHSLVINS